MKHKTILITFVSISFLSLLTQPLQTIATAKKQKSWYAHTHFPRYALAGGMGLLAILLCIFCLPNKNKIHKINPDQMPIDLEQLQREQQLKDDEELARQLQNVENDGPAVPVEDVDDEGNIIHLPDENIYRAEGPMINPNAPLTDREREHFRLQVQYDEQIRKELEERTRREQEAAAAQAAAPQPTPAPVIAPTPEPQAALTQEELRNKRVEHFGQPTLYTPQSIATTPNKSESQQNVPAKRTETAEEQAERERRVAAFMAKKQS